MARRRSLHIGAALLHLLGAGVTFGYSGWQKKTRPSRGCSAGMGRLDKVTLSGLDACIGDLEWLGQPCNPWLGSEPTARLVM